MVGYLEDVKFTNFAVFYGGRIRASPLEIRVPIDQGYLVVFTCEC